MIVGGVNLVRSATLKLVMINKVMKNDIDAYRRE